MAPKCTLRVVACDATVTSRNDRMPQLVWAVWLRTRQLPTSPPPAARCAVGAACRRCSSLAPAGRWVMFRSPPVCANMRGVRRGALWALLLCAAAALAQLEQEVTPTFEEPQENPAGSLAVSRCVGTAPPSPAAAAAAAAGRAGSCPPPLPPTFQPLRHSLSLPSRCHRTPPWCCWVAHHSLHCPLTPAVPQTAAAAASLQPPKLAAPQSSGWQWRCGMCMRLTLLRMRCRRWEANGHAGYGWLGSE